MAKQTLEQEVQFFAEYSKKQGTKIGAEYFEDTIYSLERTLREVKGYQKRFLEIEKEKNVNEADMIEWAMSSLSNLSIRNEYGSRTLVEFSKAAILKQLLSSSNEEE